MEEEKIIVCRDLEGNEFNVPSSELEWRPSVYGVIIEDGKVLLSKQWDGYDMPGGGIEIGETTKEALKREIWEETGLTVEVGDAVACEDSFFKMPISGRYVHSILHYYICKRVSGEFSIENLEDYEKDILGMPEWIRIEDIDKIKFYNSVDSREIIKKALKLCHK